MRDTRSYFTPPHPEPPDLTTGMEPPHPGEKRARAVAGIHEVPVQTYLGRYRTEHVCGTGGMSVVYRGVDTSTDRPVAIKVMSASIDWRRIQREVEALASIEHPNVVRMLDVGFDAGHMVLVMEYVAGDTLRSHLVPGAHVPWKTAARITMAVLDGLALVHDAGLVHRDIKPSNIMLVDPLHSIVKIIDFGIVQSNDQHRRITAAGTVVGTLCYMPPEQLTGGVTGPSADVYSTGLVLWQMLEGVAPASIGLESIQTKMRFSPRLSAEMPAGTRTELLRLLRDMLEPQPHERLQSANRCLLRLASIVDADGQLAETSAERAVTVDLSREEPR